MLNRRVTWQNQLQLIFSRLFNILTFCKSSCAELHICIHINLSKSDRWWSSRVTQRNQFWKSWKNVGRMTVLYLSSFGGYELWCHSLARSRFLLRVTWDEMVIVQRLLEGQHHTSAKSSFIVRAPNRALLLEIQTQCALAGGLWSHEAQLQQEESCLHRAGVTSDIPGTCKECTFRSGLNHVTWRPLSIQPQKRASFSWGLVDKQKLFQLSFN